MAAVFKRIEIPPSPPPEEADIDDKYAPRARHATTNSLLYEHTALSTRRGSTGSTAMKSQLNASPRARAKSPFQPVPSLYHPVASVSAAMNHNAIQPTHAMGTNIEPTSHSSFTLSNLLMDIYNSAFKSTPTRALSNATSTKPKVSLIPSPAAVRYAALCILWYTSSALSSNTGKAILANFRYPVTLTLVQFGFVAFYCVLFCVLRESISIFRSNGHHGGHSHHVSIASLGPNPRNVMEYLARWGIRRPSKQALHGTLVMSFFQIAGHVFSSMAIARVPVSTVHTIKALSPLFTVMSYALLFKATYSFSTYISLIPLTLGVMLACSFDLRANGIGLTCALGSTIIFVSQNIFSKKLLPKESSDSAASPLRASISSQSHHGKLDKVNLLLYSSGMAFLLMIPIWIYTDLRAQLAPKPTPPNPISSTYLFMLFVSNGSVHFTQCLLAFSILARSSPVAYSIASLIKRIWVICLAIIWFGQHIGFIQGFGMLMTFSGLWMYNRAKNDIDRGERKRAAVEKRGGIVLPSTTMDARMMASGDYPSPEPSPSVTPLPPNLSPYSTPARQKTPPAFSASRFPSGRSEKGPTWTPTQLDARLMESSSRNRGDHAHLAPESVRYI